MIRKRRLIFIISVVLALTGTLASSDVGAVRSGTWRDNSYTSVQLRQWQNVELNAQLGVPQLGVTAPSHEYPDAVRVRVQWRDANRKGPNARFEIMINLVCENKQGRSWSRSRHKTVERSPDLKNGFVAAVAFDVPDRMRWCTTQPSVFMEYARTDHSSAWGRGHVSVAVESQQR